MTPAVLNPAARIAVHHQGSERQPVIVIDDALADPAGWRAQAAAARYAPVGPYYPGLRAPVAPALAAALRAELAGPIGDAFGLDPVPPVLECWFSIVTRRPAQLAPIQRLPHFDGIERERIAILVFLSDAALGGTAFYRQRATGYETVDGVRYKGFDTALRQGVARHGLPPPSYIDADTPLYERIATYPARPNRALVYRGHTLHCAAIAPGTPLADDPRTGRLTVNAFLFGGG